MCQSLKGFFVNRHSIISLYPIIPKGGLRGYIKKALMFVKWIDLQFHVGMFSSVKNHRVLFFCTLEAEIFQVRVGEQGLLEPVKFSEKM